MIELKVKVRGDRPVPAVRTTQKKKWVDPNFKRYLQYKDRIKSSIQEVLYKTVGKLITISEDVKVSLEDVFIYIKGKRTGDIDNYLKTIMDSIQYSEIIVNDKQIKKVFNLEIKEVETEEEQGVDFTMLFE